MHWSFKYLLVLYLSSAINPDSVATIGRESYRVGSILGVGPRGRLFKASSAKYGEVSLIEANADFGERLKIEFQLLTLTSGPGVVGCYELHDRVMICEQVGFTVRQRIEKDTNFPTYGHVFRQISRLIDVLKRIHARGVSHVGLSLDTIFFHKGEDDVDQILVTNFENAKTMSTYRDKIQDINHLGLFTRDLLLSVAIKHPNEVMSIDQIETAWMIFRKKYPYMQSPNDVTAGRKKVDYSAVNTALVEFLYLASPGSIELPHPAAFRGPADWDKRRLSFWLFGSFALVAIILAAIYTKRDAIRSAECCCFRRTPNEANLPLLRHL